MFPTRLAMRASAIGMTLCAYALCVHLETRNDATYVTSLWVGLWLVWFSFQAHRGVYMACGVAVGLVAISTWLLSSVMACMVGMLIVTLLLLSSSRGPE